MPLPIQGCSLRQFNNRVIQLCEEFENTGSTAKYYDVCYMALRGIDREHGIQYSIEPLRDRFLPPRMVTMVRDYDSMIAFTRGIPVTKDMYIYAVSNPMDTLRKSIHMTVPMVINDGQVSIMIRLI